MQAGAEAKLRFDHNRAEGAGDDDPCKNIAGIDIFLVTRQIATVGHIAVARLIQGISPKTAARPRAGPRTFGDMSSLQKAFCLVAALKPGLSTAARLAVASAKRCLTPKGDEKCLAITGPTAPPSLILLLVQVPRQTWMITPRPQKRTLSELNLCKAGPDSLPIVPNQKSIGMKSDRALLRILHKQILCTSGATKDRSMTEEASTTAGHCPQNLRKSQTGIIFGLRLSQQ
jgi:hypothetical protein